MKINKDGQAQLAEYVLVAVITIGVISAMTTFYTRLVQGRIRDAHKYMWTSFRDQVNGSYHGPIHMQYEPYYLNTDGEMRQRLYSQSQLIGTTPGETGIFRQQVNDNTNLNVRSNTVPPRLAD